MASKKQAKKKREFSRRLSTRLTRGVRESAFVVLGALALYLFSSLLSYDPADPGWSHTGRFDEVSNWGGVAGAWLADVLFYLFGWLAYLAPPMIAWTGWLVYHGDGDAEQVTPMEMGLRWLSFVVALMSGCGLAELHFAAGDLPMHAGGLLGIATGAELASLTSSAGATLLLLALFLAGFTLFTGISWGTVMEFIGEWTLFGVGWVKEQFDLWQQQAKRKAAEKRKVVLQPVKRKPHKRKKPRIEPKVVTKMKQGKKVGKERQMPLFRPTPKEGDLPTIDLLDPPVEQTQGYSEDELEAMSRLVELKLADFKVDVKVESTHPGPVVTRFELALAPGTKVSKITGLAKDLARSLSVISVRVVEVIPGKTTIGLEIPNEHRQMVSLSEILASEPFERAKSPLTLGLGKDISGDPVVADVAKMPHLLVAGTTGSGKSVAVNAMLLSVLFKATPEEVRLILIDPKMLELSVYEGIPHLLTPVVTEMKDAATALRWCVAEMERRYRLMSALSVRNMAGYNRKVREAIDRGEPIKDPLWKPNELIEDDQPGDLETLPSILIVIDEFADLMMTVGKKVEELIARLAQKARAAGIHLILATQRPSVDVITGLIKANIPSRIAFQVSSKVDSRTILDQMGAEALLGHGDMLYLPGGTSIPVRIHGAFVDDHEVLNVAEFLRESGQPDYLPEILEGSDELDGPIPGLEPVGGGGGDESDPLYDQAVAIVTESRKASISYVQRRLKVGYNRAARMIEQMEAAGVVSAVQGGGSREVIAPPPPEV